jgi:hypothetical protein
MEAKVLTEDLTAVRKPSGKLIISDDETEESELKVSFYFKKLRFCY